MFRLADTAVSFYWKLATHLAAASGPLDESTITTKDQNWYLSALARYCSIKIPADRSVVALSEPAAHANISNVTAKFNETTAVVTWTNSYALYVNSNNNYYYIQ